MEKHSLDLIDIREDAVYILVAIDYFSRHLSIEIINDRKVQHSYRNNYKMVQ